MEAPKSPEAEQLLAIVGQYRGALKTIGTDVKNIKAHAFFQMAASTSQDFNADRGEMIANIMLSYRALEDARMRLGKVFEAYFGENIGDGPLPQQK